MASSGESEQAENRQGNAGRRITQDLPASTRARLEFQLEAARIQSANARIVADTAERMKRLYESRHWRPEDAKALEVGLTEERRLTREWENLDPPDPLRELWAAVSELMGGLIPLFEETASLGDASPDELLGRVRDLQQRFNSHLSEMNEAEGRLLQAEKDLRGT